MSPRKSYYYELTRRSPGPLRQGSTKAIIYEVMKRLKKASPGRVVDEVLAHKDFRTRQQRPEQQIEWYLWDFEKRGLLLRHPNRRYQSERV
jgi:hypothetical protein